MDPFIGTIIAWPCNFAPQGWAFCNGQILQISTNQALFSLIGTTYGGDGRTTFALPNLCGRVPLGAGQGTGLTPRILGQVSGSERVTLSVNEMPGHNHASSGIPASTKTATVGQPGPTAVPGSYEKERGTYYNIYSPEADANTTLKPAAPTGAAGGGQSHDNMPPYLAVNYIIALQGIYPTRD
ncbi:Phage Tail Collar Domain protein [Pelotomaculum sp. FP]|uniref:phage tail protein n=1 Tax=Pelotomaculum sp. FP TaxID=261474 RepID=UPI0011012C61|nr:tail fiber protein [Pelotomaculum sp. FP]TEB13508.1 Phage Tail Collar Domain protein [Pelotomaculum sp. FP]